MPGVMLVSLWLAVDARAEVPTDVAIRYDLASGKVKRLSVSEDEIVIAGVSGDGRLVVLDQETWRADVASPCEVTSAAVRHVEANPVTDVDETWLVWVGCDDGYVRTMEWNGSVVRPYEGDLSLSEVQIAQNPLVGLWYRPSDRRVYAIAEATGAALRVQDVDMASGDTSTGNIEFIQRTYKEGVFVAGAVATDDWIYISHGGNDFSQLNLSSRIVTNIIRGTVQVDPEDVTMNVPAVPGARPTGLLFADSQRGLVQWAGAIGIGQQQPFIYLAPALDNLKTVAVQFGATRTTPEAVFVQSGSRMLALDPQGLALGSSLAEFEIPFTTVDMVEGIYGYMIAGDSAGRLVVMTARPFIDGVDLSTYGGETGTEVELSFTVDQGGDWRVVVGGDRTGSGGDEILSGTVEAGGTVTESFTVDEAFSEGVNPVWVFVENDGLTGHARANFLRDNAPGAISLDQRNVGVGNHKIFLSFNVDADADADKYNVYLSTSELDPSAFSTGGPTASEEADGFLSPQVFDASGTGAETLVLTGLQNYVNYWIAVRPVDGSGNEGEMSNVVQGMPLPTSTSARVVGEEGGAPCACQSGPGGFGVAAVAALALLRRRRAPWGALVALAVVGTVGDAHAQERKPFSEILARDITPAWASFEIRHNFQQLEQAELKDAYGDWVSVLQLEAGPQIFRVAEIDFGVGFMTHKGAQLTSDGAPSDEKARMQWLPLSLGATARVHIFDDQPVVPYAGAGIDWIFWREDELDGDEKALKSTRMVGSKNGWHWHAGANILLDSFAPGRSSRLEALTGINDTWLTVEYRAQKVGPNSGGFDFSGGALSIGLKIDY